MKRKQQFLQAVQILAPNDPFIYQAAQRIPEELLPIAPGGVALELVVAMQRRQCANQGNNCQRAAESERPLSLSHQLRIKSAEYWLKLGEADQALKELERLPKGASSHPAALKAVVNALGALREQAEMQVQE